MNEDKHLERGWEILLDLEQHGHPCECEPCDELWQEYIKLRNKVLEKEKNG